MRTAKPRVWLVFSVLLVAVLAAVLATAPGLSARQGAVPAADKVPPKVEPFDLRDVKLLDGPFREAMLRDQRYLLELDPDRLLHNFRVNAGLPSTATPLGGWEAPDVELRGHTVGHYLTALALMYRATGDDRFKARADRMVAELAKVQDALPSKGFNKGYLSAFPESFIDRVEKRERVWAPYYTLHKIMAGLLDVHLLCGNAQALDVVSKMADWVYVRMSRLTPDQQQAMLRTEFGGMNDVLANLYAVTGTARYLETARMFDHRALFDPLAKGVDPLDGLHGNTQFPKIIGAVREYELTGEPRYYDIARFFWERVALHRSYVTGGNTDDEGFFPVGEFSHHLSETTTETCNTYNMLKLTRALFELDPSAERMDFYERGLFNHILASQDPATGAMCYYVPLKPGAFKTYNTPDQSFWCCTGTGMENHAKYADTIYFHDAQGLWVNLFIASELTWRERGIVVRQETAFPEEGATRLTFTVKKPVRVALHLRYPKWAAAGMMIVVNREPELAEAAPGSYVTIDRLWNTGDVVQVKIPMSLHVEAMPDDPKTIALLFGPIVLAGDLGTEGLADVKRYGPSAPPLGRLRTPTIPAFVGQVDDLLAAVKPVATEPLAFEVPTASRRVLLRPFYKTFEPRYTVYWRIYTPEEWKTRRAEAAAAESRRQQIERRTIDAVVVNDAESERAHALQGERTSEGWLEGVRYREARGGWFSYELKVTWEPVALVCTYRGAEGQTRAFDILVDGQKLVSESLPYHPTETFDREYPLPEAFWRDKEKITVRFQAPAGAATGAVFDVRTVAVAGVQ